ncbi:helix-turn-helix domain-containing protein [Oceanibacterium hippocampi]|uniref:HTH cro/C1-type domain-containing protein n=1 Tax=Oceanibacterium hippocampi TaxID=745714 RepID=A0A1Y5U2W0_9PROT|nr:helix-turn-helix domain-containing protein [Oceanibacterium hippocampi]SLN77263.1 hypothetical protein OCH7691_04356 [Oceanibacterium hippocampi]
MTDETPLKRNLQRVMRQRKLSQRGLARLAGLNEGAVKSILAGRSQHPRHDTLQALAKAVGWDMQELISDLPPTPRGGDGIPSASIPEVDVRGGMEGGGGLLPYEITDQDDDMIADSVTGRWSMPDDFLRSELRMAQRAGRIIQIVGDSMAPTLSPGDRVILNLADRWPAPPGIFALWDGFGVVCKRLEFVPHSDPPTMRVLSDNRNHPPYDRVAGDVRVIGRVVGMIRRF